MTVIVCRARRRRLGFVDGGSPRPTGSRPWPRRRPTCSRRCTICASIAPRRSAIFGADQPRPGIASSSRTCARAEMPALKSALAVVERIDYPAQQRASGRGPRAAGEEARRAARGVRRGVPAAEGGAPRRHSPRNSSTRRPRLLETLDKLSARLTRLVKLEDAYVDQLMEIKQLAWVARNAGGDASVMISNALGGLPLPADPMLKLHHERRARSRPPGRRSRTGGGRPAAAGALRRRGARRRRANSSRRTSSRCASSMLKMLVAGREARDDARRNGPA